MHRRVGAITAACTLLLTVLPLGAARADDGPRRVCPADSFSFAEGFGADRGGRSHMGIDMMGKRGTVLRAIEDGRINRTKRQDNGALQIVMKGESGSMFYYGHMDEVLIKGGDKVSAGDVIGLMGDSGSPGAVHLHFEYWKSGGESDAVDPEPLVRRVCNRDGGNSDGRAAAADQPSRDKKRVTRPQREAAPRVVGEIFTN